MRAAGWPAELRLEDALLLAAVVLLPWAFGGVEIWAYRSAAALLVAACAAAWWRDGRDGLGLERSALWLLPALFLAIWAALQIVPLPAAAIRVASPTADALYRETFPGYAAETGVTTLDALETAALARVGEPGDIPPSPRSVEALRFDVAGRWDAPRTVSLFPLAGIEKLAWYAALLGAFLIVRRRCRDADVARIYRLAIAASVTALALFGLVYAATANGKVYWIRPTIEPTNPFGPYVNPTNFAAVMELAVPWLAGLALARASSVRVSVLRDGPALFLAAAAALGLLAAIASASKAGAPLILLALTLLGVVAARGWRARCGVVFAAAGAAAVGLLSLRATRLGERFGELVAQGSGGLGEIKRLAVWREAWAMFEDYPLTGAGFGAFGEAFSHYVPMGGNARWTQLHNDYGQLILEGGVVAGALTLWLALGFLRRVLSRASLRDARGRVDAAQLGLLLGLATLAVHAAFDFNHQIPANGLLFVTLAALAVARVDEVRASATPATRGGRSWLGAVLLLLLAGLFAWRAAEGWIAGPAYSRGRWLAGLGDYAEALGPLDRGAVGPLRPATLWLAGQTRHGLWRDRYGDGEPPEAIAYLMTEASRDQTTAIALSPASGWYWAALGDLYHERERIERLNEGIPLASVGGDPWAQVGRPGRVALGMMRIAIEREPSVYRFYDQLALALWGYGLREHALYEVRRSARVQPLFYDHYYTSFEKIPEPIVDAFAEASWAALGHTPLLRRVNHLIDLAKVEFLRGNPARAAEALREALTLPATALERAEAHFNLGLAQLNLGEFDDAERHLVAAQEHPIMRKSALQAEARSARSRGDLARALDRLREVRRHDPRDVDAVLEFAEVAVGLARWEAADQALRQAAALDPENRRASLLQVEVYLARGERVAAEAALDEAERRGADAAAIEALRRRLRSAPSPAAGANGD